MGERLRIMRVVAGLILVAALLSPALANAQTAATRPAISRAAATSTKDDADFESRPLNSTAIGATPTTNPSSTLNGIPAPAHSIGFDLGRMAIALAIVLGMIFGARWLFTHFFAGARAPATSEAVKVLSRTSLAPRQQVLLLKIGRRVVVVGESSGQLSPLSQLDDPDEVAALVGQLQEEQIRRAASFGGLFGRAQRKLAEEDEHSSPTETGEAESGSNPHGEPPGAAEVKSELSGLLDKVRSIRNQLGQ